MGTTSPPPHENFVALPPIRSPRPLWDLANPDRPDQIVGENSATVTLPDAMVGILASFFPKQDTREHILAYLYFYARPQPGPGPKELDVPRTLVFSIFLFASSFTFWRSEVALTKQRRGSMLGWLALTILLGGIFLVGQGTEYWHRFTDRGIRGPDVFNHVLHPDWLPRFARAPCVDCAADFSLGGVGG